MKLFIDLAELFERSLEIVDRQGTVRETDVG